MKQLFFKASEFAAFCGTTKDTLRWYDRKGILKPAVVGENGYRYYRPAQFFDYSTIATMKQTGSSLKEIEEFPRLPREEQLALLQQKERELHRIQQELADMQRTITDIRQSLQFTIDLPAETPELVELERVWLAVTVLPAGIGWFEGESEDYMVQHIRHYQSMPGVHTFPQGTVLRADAICAEKPVELAYFREAEAGACQELWERPAGTFVRILHSGNYSGIPNTLKTAADFIREKGLRVSGNLYEYDTVSVLTMDEASDAQLLLIPVEQKTVQNIPADKAQDRTADHETLPHIDKAARA